MSRISDRAQDLFSASNEEAIDEVLSTVFPEVAKQITEGVASDAISEIIGVMSGALFPRVYGVYLNYKQKRIQRNVLVAINQLNKRCDEIEKSIKARRDRELVSQMVEFLFDNIIDEPQLDKVMCSVNGFIGLLCDESTNEDMALMFFRTIFQLNRLDIQLLELLASFHTLPMLEAFKKENNLSSDFYIFTVDKLERLGLIINNVEKRNDKRISDYFKQASNNKSTAKPPRLENANHKSFSVSKLGKKYIELMKGGVGIT